MKMEILSGYYQNAQYVLHQSHMSAHQTPSFQESFRSFMMVMDVVIILISESSVRSVM